ncbi:hypothetical protein ACFQ9X_05110 [Catenulispora yoronensis]
MATRTPSKNSKATAATSASKAGGAAGTGGSGGTAKKGRGKAAASSSSSATPAKGPRPRRPGPGPAPAKRRRRTRARGRPAPRSAGEGHRPARLGLPAGYRAQCRPGLPGAKALHPDHRRDGIGFALIGLGIVMAAALWHGFPGAVPQAIVSLVAGAFGRVGAFTPLLVFGLAIRVIRRPEEAADTNRMSIGWSAFTVAAVGLIHISGHMPRPSDGATAMRNAGGGSAG